VLLPLLLLPLGFFLLALLLLLRLDLGFQLRRFAKQLLHPGPIPLSFSGPALCFLRVLFITLAAPLFFLRRNLGPYIYSSDIPHCIQHRVQMLRNFDINAALHLRIDPTPLHCTLNQSSGLAPLPAQKLGILFNLLLRDGVDLIRQRRLRVRCIVACPDLLPQGVIAALFLEF
jgi:hypothetical protein